MKVRFTAAATAVCLAFAAQAEGPAQPAAQPAEFAPRAADATLLDIAPADGALVAVGARGHILRSTDGAHWEQQPVPARAMLNRAVFCDARTGYAVGHDGLILKTGDGGAHWQIQHREVSSKRARVLYDAAFFSPQEGFAFGAFGLLLGTTDGGATWTPQDNALSQSGLYLNAALRRGDNGLAVVGEHGLVALSNDRGKTWKLASPPYVGSFFGVLPLGQGGLLVFGQRGHLYAVDDPSRLKPGDPASFDPLSATPPTDAQAAALGFRRIAPASDDSLFGGTVLADGSFLLVGSEGAVVRVDAAAKAAQLVLRQGATTYARVLERKRELWVVGLDGVHNLAALPEPVR